MITVREANAATHHSLQYDQLITQRCILCLKPALRLERRGA
jgi:hypothetical protein